MAESSGETRQQNKPHFEKDTNLNSLRDDPRFAELLSKIHENGE